MNMKRAHQNVSDPLNTSTTMDVDDWIVSQEKVELQSSTILSLPFPVLVHFNSPCFSEMS